MTTQELAKLHPEAFNALPESYQNDSCLEFFWYDGKLYAVPAKGQEAILGEWKSVFSEGWWQDAKDG